MKLVTLRNRLRVVLPSGRELNRGEAVEVSEADYRVIERHAEWRVDVEDKPAESPGEEHE